jgi:hypothetical protein
VIEPGLAWASHPGEVFAEDKSTDPQEEAET